MCPCDRLSGVCVKEAVDDLIKIKEKIGLRDGPAISDLAGIALKAMDLNDCLHEILEDLFDNKRELFPKHVLDKEKLRKSYQVFRTFRRTSDT